MEPVVDCQHMNSAIIHRAWFAYPQISEYLDLRSLWQLSMTCKDFRSLRKFVKTTDTFQLGDFDHSKSLLVTFDGLCDKMQTHFIRNLRSKNVIYANQLKLDILQRLPIGFPHVELFFQFLAIGARNIVYHVDIPIDKIHFNQINFASSYFTTLRFQNLKELVFSYCVFTESFHDSFDSPTLQHISFINCHFMYERFRIQEVISPTLQSITLQDCTFQNETNLFCQNMPVHCKISIVNCESIYVPKIIVKKRKNIE